MANAHWMEKAFGNAHGQLHKETGTPKGKKIPMAKLMAAKKRGGLEAERAQAALNARKANGLLTS